MREKNITRNCWLLMLLATAFLASACSSDDEAVAPNDYCYIKSVTLGTVKRKIERRDRMGNLLFTVDANVTGSNFGMTINQRDNTIENRDSLPYGCNLTAVTAAITFDGSLLTYREKGSNAGWNAYNSTDTLNLTKPLEFMLTSNDGLSSRIYALKVNVHDVEGDSLYWTQCESEVEQLTGMAEMKSFVMDDKLMVLGKESTGETVLAERSSIEEQGTWNETTITDLPSTAELQTLRQKGDKLFLSTKDGMVFSSSDAKAWQQEGTTYPGSLTLIEKTDAYFYAISVTGSPNGTICELLRSLDAADWSHKEMIDAEADFLPTSGIRTLTLQQANGSTRIVMVGQRDGEREEYKNALVWNKMWNNGWNIHEDDDGTSGHNVNSWIYFPLSPDNTLPCPKMEHLNLLPYDGKCIAFGGASADGTRKALDALYVSQDYGITWRPDDELHLPIQLEGIDGCITSAVDKNNFIWIITNAQVWRGRLNRLGFVQH